MQGFIVTGPLNFSLIQDWSLMFFQDKERIPKLLILFATWHFYWILCNFFWKNEIKFKI